MTLKLSVSRPITPAMDYRPATILLCALALLECVACVVAGVLA